MTEEPAQQEKTTENPASTIQSSHSSLSAPSQVFPPSSLDSTSGTKSLSSGRLAQFFSPVKMTEQPSSSTKTRPSLQTNSSELSKSATSGIRSKLKKLQSSPTLPTMVDMNRKDSSSSPTLASPTELKRTNGFLSRRKDTAQPTELTIQAQVRRQSTQDSIVPFSFAKGSTPTSGPTTTIDLSYASNISSYQISQRPVPQTSKVTRRTFSLSRLTRHKASAAKNNNTIEPNFHASPELKSSHETKPAPLFAAVKRGGPRITPAQFLPDELQSTNWSLSAKYTSTKISLKTMGHKVLGKGATATVMIVQSNQKQANGHRAIYAAKVYNKCPAGQNLVDHYSKIASEYKIAHRLYHRNVVHIYDLCMDPGDSWCSVMDFCEVGDLFSLMESYKISRTRKMGREERSCLFKQLLLGISYIHSQGIAHRDIKPENLLITSKGELKISDFGVAVVVFDTQKKETEDNLRLSAGLAGSIPYLPPEVFESKKDPENVKYDARLVDIWSCACTYINLVIGGGFFSKATITDDPAFARFVKELNRYWQHEKQLNDFLIGEGEKSISAQTLQSIQDYATSTAKQVERIAELAEAQVEDAAISQEKVKVVLSESTTGSQTSTESLPSEPSEPSSPCTKPVSPSRTPLETCHEQGQMTRSFIMNMTEEQQPLFFFNEFGEAGKRLLARMLMPDPAYRPQIQEVMETSIIRRLGTCQIDDSIAQGISLKSVRKGGCDCQKIQKHTHQLYTKAPSLLGLGFKDPYKDM